VNRGVDISTRQLEAPGEEERLVVTGVVGGQKPGETKRGRVRSGKLLWWRKDRQPVVAPSAG
jgi:hypothetical protein